MTTASDTKKEKPKQADSEPKAAAKEAAAQPTAFNVGDRVRVHVAIKEGEKERIQVFEGRVIKKRRGENGSFTVRKVSFGIGVERVFPLVSPKVAKVEVVGKTKLTRSKLYYLRKRSGKSARIAEVR